MMIFSIKYKQCKYILYAFLLYDGYDDDMVW